MYTQAYSPSAAALVALWTGDSTPVVEYELAVAAWERLFTEGRGRDPFAFVIADANHSGMTAEWRKRFAEVEIRGNANCVIVSSSLVVRGIVTAINWMRPPKSALKTTIFGTLEEGLRLMDKEFSSRSGIVRDLHDQAREELYMRASGRSSVAMRRGSVKIASGER